MQKHCRLRVWKQWNQRSDFFHRHTGQLWLVHHGNCCRWTLLSGNLTIVLSRYLCSKSNPCTCYLLLDFLMFLWSCSCYVFITLMLIFSILKRAFQLLSSGLFLPGSLGIINPCEVHVIFFVLRYIVSKSLLLYGEGWYTRQGTLRPMLFSVLSWMWYQSFRTQTIRTQA